VLRRPIETTGIVSVTSQLDGQPTENGSLFFGDVHSAGTFSLGFSPPSVLEGIISSRIVPHSERYQTRSFVSSIGPDICLVI
jgi:hypothetical protein